MKRMLNTLYVMTQGAYLSKEGETIVVKVDGDVKLRLPFHTLDGVVCFGRIGCSPALVGACGEKNVTLSLMTENGRFLGRFQGPVSGNVLLRREQYRRADDESRSVEIAGAMIAAKIINKRTVLQRALRDGMNDEHAEGVRSAVERLNRILGELKGADALDAVRGYEGEAARCYFDVFNHLITGDRETFYFQERSRRPPLDCMNAMLSFYYTLLMHDAVSALESVGLDPAVGFLHRDRPGRYGLALDLMEEFRPYLADRLALSLVNRKQVNSKGFTVTETGAVYMDDGTRKDVVQAYQKRKQEEIRHPFIGEQIKVGLLLYAQALLLSRFLRGDLDGYPPFLWK